MSEIAEFWAVVDLLGKSSTVGRCRWLMQGQTCVLLQIEAVGPDPEQFSHTEMYGIGAIYRVSTCTEEEARQITRVLKDFGRYSRVAELLTQYPHLPSPTPVEDEDENEVPF